THQTPVKERHEILSRFRDGTYRTLVASHVLNEGVDVPAASVAILLSGTGSTREYIQRLGRVLRKGSGDKVARLYEVIAEETAEEGVSKRRRKKTKKPTAYPVLPFQGTLSSYKAAESDDGPYTVTHPEEEEP
ncbi:MAG: helicase-related protein, partial [Leptolyngbyaceae bacterium]|nr:helicase-related protein [Leptolyngbyaceae bacterium]